MLLVVHSGIVWVLSNAGLSSFLFFQGTLVSFFLIFGISWPLFSVTIAGIKYNGVLLFFFFFFPSLSFACSRNVVKKRKEACIAPSLMFVFVLCRFYCLSTLWSLGETCCTYCTLATRPSGGNSLTYCMVNQLNG